MEMTLIYIMRRLNSQGSVEETKFTTEPTTAMHYYLQDWQITSVEGPVKSVEFVPSFND